MRHFDTAGSGMIHHLSYSALVDDPETTLRPVLDHLGLSWHDAIQSFHILERVVRTPSSEQVRRTLNRDGIEV